MTFRFHLHACLVLFGLCALLSACARDTEAGAGLSFAPAQTQLDYAVELDGAPDEQIDALMRASLQLFRRRENGAQSLAFLRRRATQDIAVAKKILGSFGYFEGGAEVEITPGPAPDALAQAEDGAPDFATVHFTITPGRAFTLAAHRLKIVEAGATPPPELSAQALGSPVGARAQAAPILAAEGRAAARLRQQGRPYARLLGRESIADLETGELEVGTRIAAGDEHVFAAPGFDGLESVDPAYLATYQSYREGEIWDQRKLEQFRQDLSQTRLFDSVAVRAPEQDPGGRSLAPVIIVQEARHRTVSAGARYNTDTGPSARVAFEHRNVFGANETFNASLQGGLEEQHLDLGYRKPQYLRPGQDFTAALGLRHIEDDDSFDETALLITAGLERDLSRRWTVGAGGLIEIAETGNDEGKTQYILGGIPVFASFDDVDDLLSPTRGERLRADITPFFGVNGDDDMIYFFKLDARGSVYRPLDAANRFVLAGRARVASITAAQLSDAPQGRRLYSGGGGSVRGFANRSIGPRNADNEPTGGLSAVELGAELRALVYDPLGVAVFVEGASVGPEIYPEFDDPLVAAGGGLRYYSPIGPIRLDVGVPLNARDDDDAFQVYLSIGQAY